MSTIDIRSKFLGGLLGHALGDAIGELAFSSSNESSLRDILEKIELLRYTDDTAMALGIAESLVSQGTLDLHHLGETFRKNFEREPWRGYAPGPPTVFTLVRQGYSYQEAAQSLFGGSGSFGNGAAMRITPLGLFFHDSRELYERAAQSAAVTHAHPLGKDGAAVLAGAVAMAVSLSSEAEFPLDQFLGHLEKIPRTPNFKEKLSLMIQLIDEGADRSRAARELGTNVTIHGSVPFALCSFLRNPSSFTKCLCHAILVRGDRDTLGAMACGLSGAYLGVEQLPAKWLRKLENREYIEELALSLFKKKSCS